MRSHYKQNIDISDYSNDGRLTEKSDGQKYQWKQLISEAERLGRALTEEEAKRFRVE